MWGWWNYLQRVQPEVCVLGAGLTPASIDDALRNGRCNLQLAVQTLLGPILEQQDERAIRDITGDAESEIASVSSSSRSEGSGSRSSSSGMSSSGSDGSGRLARRVLGEESFQNTFGSEDSWKDMGSHGSRGSRESVESAEPSLQAMEMGKCMQTHK